MRCRDTEIEGLQLLETEEFADDRGSFFRAWCQEEFAQFGLAADWVQHSFSRNRRRGTLRGLHLQAAPGEEIKLVRCTRGRIFDVAVDLRPNSPTWGRWFGTELSAENREALYIPEGFAHGFQALEDESEVYYLISEFYQPDLARGVRWNDPELAIPWPLADPILSPRDQKLPWLEEIGKGD